MICGKRLAMAAAEIVVDENVAALALSPAEANIFEWALSYLLVNFCKRGTTYSDS